jgi:predicted thioesterase
MSSGKPHLGLQPGAIGREELIVNDSVLVGKDRVFPLARLVAHIEQAALWSVQPMLPSDMTTVGYEVKVELLERVAIGAVLEIATRLVEADGRHLLFDVQVTTENRHTAEGFHRRTVVPMSQS